jgi:hypothetical protein
MIYKYWIFQKNVSLLECVLLLVVEKYVYVIGEKFIPFREKIEQFCYHQLDDLDLWRSLAYGLRQYV